MKFKGKTGTNTTNQLQERKKNTDKGEHMFEKKKHE